MSAVLLPVISFGSVTVLSANSLAALVSEEINKATGHETPEVKDIIEKIIAQINSLWESSSTEEVYVEKLEALVSGIKKAL